MRRWMVLLVVLVALGGGSPARAQYGLDVVPAATGGGETAGTGTREVPRPPLSPEALAWYDATLAGPLDAWVGAAGIEQRGLAVDLAEVVYDEFVVVPEASRPAEAVEFRAALEAFTGTDLMDQISRAYQAGSRRSRMLGRTRCGCPYRAYQHLWPLVEQLAGATTYLAIEARAD